MAGALADAFRELEGRSLSSVEFVQDYLQLGFDGPQLTTFTHPVVSSGSDELTWESPDFCNRLCAQIGHSVIASRADGDEVSIRFDNDVEIIFSLREEDYDGPKL